MTTLRAFHGLQSYPSCTKDPFPVDHSTGSVGLGAAAPLFGALTDRYVSDHFGHGTGGRFISLLGDAELESQFETAGWHVIECKYGRRLREAYAKEGGELLRRRIDEMPNQVYQGLFGASEEVVLEIGRASCRERV